MSTVLLMHRYIDEELVEPLTIITDDARSTFEWTKRLPCAGTELAEGVLVIDLLEGDDINEDPITIRPDAIDWYLHEFLKLSRATRKKLIREWKREASTDVR